MGNVIRMDLYRLIKSLSFKICLLLVFLLNLIEGPVTKLLFNLSKKLVENSDKADEAAKEVVWDNTFHLGNTIAGSLGAICTAIFLLCIVKFCYADIQHGFIKNIAGQLPSRGHTIVSKFVVIQLSIFMFYFVTVVGIVIGNLIVGRSIKMDMVFTDIDDTAERVFPMSDVFIEFAIKWLLLSGLCAVILLLTTAVGSNVAGTIVAVLCGAGFTGLAYSGISVGVNKLLKLDDFDLSDYMPDSLYRTNIIDEKCITRSLIVAAVTIVVVLYFTTTLYNKRDIK